MKQSSSPTYLLLLPLLAVLLFGNCGGGGVRGVVTAMTTERHQRFRAIVAQQQARRAQARQQLRGGARRTQLRRIDSLRTARIDSFFRPAPSSRYEEYIYPGAQTARERAKYQHRRRKMTRQLLSPDNRPLIPPIRFNIDTR
ncbi:hypothetical protein ACFST9_21435 [Hymenobacter monticola]|uniref:Uncharacterized protein n=1 Tax=Hymenobacter monticola TaxID=1705399 RepID=A0ABY4B7R6_9BACT|nr:hypothetical protein [Hymenobacter monticola]UOE34337.1 hypothetical protein MTP16_01475 [Hymenobacter monticola]